jgi:hypothetical protein
MQQIPLDTWEQTGLGVWGHPRLAIGTRYQEAVTTLYTLACHVRDFERLPDTDEFGNALLQEYLYDLRDTFAEYLQNMLDVSSEMSRYVGELTSVQMESRFYLLETFKLLAEVHQAFTPVDSKNEEIKAQLTMADVVAWVDRMTMVIGKAKLVSLLWAADVVENGS